MPPQELLKQLELLKKQEEALLQGKSLGYAHTTDAGGHCVVLLEAFKVREEEDTGVHIPHHAQELTTG